MYGNRLTLSSVTLKRTVSNLGFLPPSSTSTLSTRVTIFLFVLIIFSLASASTAISLEGSGVEVMDSVPQHDSLKSSSSLLSSEGATSPQRVKRSRDAQRLCGYRLVDALRSVCDRNFVGFTRRSDPALFAQSNDGQSGEEQGSVAPFSGLSPWEILTFELPQSSAGSQVGDDNPMVSSTSNNLDASMLDYMELLQQQVPTNPFATPVWPPFTGRGAGIGGTGTTSGNKAFTLKMLTESPKTHQRFRRNIVEECCLKPCAMNQMLKYCASSAVGKRSY